MNVYVHDYRWAPRRPRPLYAAFPVAEVSQQALREWLLDTSAYACPLAHDPHVTVAWSLRAIDWNAVPDCGGLVIPAQPRTIERWGKYVVLLLASPELQRRWMQYRLMAGASWDYPSYQPHLTLSTDPDFPLDIPPYTGPLTLGPEQRALPKE